MKRAISRNYECYFHIVELFALMVQTSSCEMLSAVIFIGPLEKSDVPDEISGPRKLFPDKQVMYKEIINFHQSVKFHKFFHEHFRETSPHLNFDLRVSRNWLISFLRISATEQCHRRCGFNLNVLLTTSPQFTVGIFTL